MSKQYSHYSNITKEILDTVKVGDLIKIKDWKKPMRVKAVSENYFVMTNKQFGDTYYSVCSKIPWGDEGRRHNRMVGGMFHCGADNWIFGTPLGVEYEDIYEFNDEESNKLYLQELESGETRISERSGIAIYDLYIKSVN